MMVRNFWGKRPDARLVLLLPFAFVAACATAQAPSSTDPAANGPADPVPPAAGPTTFTAAQVEVGDQTFTDSCSDCHSTSEFRGSDFQYRFRRRTAWHLYTMVSETMPEDAPGSLSSDSYVAVVAYILSMNGYDTGQTPLAATQEALGALPLDQFPPGQQERN